MLFIFFKSFFCSLVSIALQLQCLCMYVYGYAYIDIYMILYVVYACICVKAMIEIHIAQDKLENFNEYIGVSMVQ